MEKLDSLDFTNANNACLSLRTLAEWVRTGEIAVSAFDPEDGVIQITAAGRPLKERR